MTIKNLTFALGLAGALALAAASPTLAKTKHKKAAQQAQTEESADPGSAYGAHTGAYAQQGYAYLRGYSARPQGMCWVRGGGGGSDMVGDWEACPSK